MDYYTFGSTPCDENCAQVGRDNYHEQSRIECRAYINQLKRVIKELTSYEYGSDDFTNKYESFTLRVKSFPHDFGNYHEVCAMFDDEESCQLANDIDNSLPENWDEEALKELAERNYTLHLELS